MKKLLVALMVVVLFMVGCSDSGKKEITKEKTESDQVTKSEEKVQPIEYWSDKPLTADVVDGLKSIIESKNDVEFDYVVYTDPAAYSSAIKQSISQAEAPGMFTWWTGSSLEELVKEGLVVDLTDEWDYYEKNGVNRDLAKAMTYDGKIYGAPQNSLNFAVAYNKELFEEYNVHVPTTFEEFLEVCETFKQAGITPIGQKDDAWAGFYWFQQLLAAHDVSLYNGICDGSTSFEDPRVVEVFKKWEDMLKKGYFSEPMHLSNDLYPAFVKKEVAMMMEESYLATDIERSTKIEPGKQYDIFALPNISENTDRVTVFYEVAPLLVAANSDQKDTAIELLRTYYETDVAQFLVDNKGLVTSANVKLDSAVLANYSKLSADAEKYQLALRYYENTPSELRDLVLAELSKFTYQASDAQKTCEELQKIADTYWNK